MRKQITTGILIAALLMGSLTPFVKAEAACTTKIVKIQTNTTCTQQAVSKKKVSIRYSKYLASLEKGKTKKSDKTKKSSKTTKKTTSSVDKEQMSTFSKQVLTLVNQERKSAGLAPLTTSNSLQKAANQRAKEIATSFSHTRLDGSSSFTVLDEFSIQYRAAGENIAYGQRTPDEVMQAWMNSSGHRANILGSQFGKIGIGIYQSKSGVYYWTQIFTN
ncbi:MAG: hypothetical protein PWP24_551 [Clostridiales bacterium]|nr:hypothetical protein [Clostridiales bacterium]